MWRQYLIWLPRVLKRETSHLRRRFATLVWTLSIACLVAGCEEQILHDLSEQDANKVLSRLSAGNLEATKVLQSDGRWAIAVSRDAIIPTLAYLDTNRVLSPRSSVASIGGKSGFVPSREEQWFRYERSMSVSIEDSLSSMLGVLEARVHLNLPETDPLFGTRKENTGSGSVLLVVDSRYVAKDEEISSLVSGAAGIPAEKVAVLKSQAKVPVVVTPYMPKIAQKIASTEQNVGVTGFLPQEIPVHEVGLASAAVVAVMGIGFFIFKLRRKKVTFSLPTSSVSEE